MAKSREEMQRDLLLLDNKLRRLERDMREPLLREQAQQEHRILQSRRNETAAVLRRMALVAN